MRRAVVAAIAIAIAACARIQSTEPPERLGTTTTPLVAESERLTGADLPAKHLIFTFDDGPTAATSVIATYLGAHAIHATFFVTGSCIATTTLPNPHCATPTADAPTILGQVTAAGHLLGNHTTTGRDLVTEVAPADIVKELAETDALLAPFVPWNKRLFRAPHGSWSAVGSDANAVYDTLKTTALNDYTGPIFWNIGGGPTDGTHASDTECWSLGYSAQKCGDLYLHEIHARSSGIVLLHDTTQTLDLLKYIVPLLEADGFTFDALDQSAAVNALEPKCDSACMTCTGPSASACASCPLGARLIDNACLACTICTPGTFTAAVCGAATNTVCLPCAAGTFQPGSGATSCSDCGNCDDGNVCTADSCAAADGCTHTKIANCPAPDASVTIPTESDSGTPDRTGGFIDDNAGVPVDDSSDGGCSASSRRPRSSFSAAALCSTLGILLSVRRRTQKRRLSSEE